MIGILVVSHGELAEAIVSSVQLLVGKLQKIKSISIWPGDGKEEIEARIEKEIAEVDEGDGVIFLTDMLGGTPTNLSLSYLKGKHAEVITGVNMPMLLLLSSHRAEKSLERMAALVKKAGRRSITLPKSFLGWRRRRIGSDFLPMLQDGDHKRQKCRGSFAGDQKENLAMPV
jgi:PTS system mannose-specific IIA component